MAVWGILLSPALLAPHKTTMVFIRAWARAQLWGLRVICNVRVEFRGLEHRPNGAALIAGKHQGMLDVIVPFVLFDDPAVVMKKELMALPFFGWFAAKAKMISVDREAHATALKQLVRDVRTRMEAGRQIVIFPEGTRTAPGAEPDYKPGVAALYRDIEAPCTPMATNSGLCWPAHGFIRRPGVVVYELLEPVPAGLKRGPFMAELQRRIEDASNALLP
jgi:1-acyl-sn-glycerol-3-phosphate acyltransferase